MLKNHQGALVCVGHLEIPVLNVHREALRSNALVEIQVFNVHPRNQLAAPVLQDRATQVVKVEEDNDLPLFCS